MSSKQNIRASVRVNSKQFPAAQPHWMTILRGSSREARSIIPAKLAEQYGVLPLSVCCEQNGDKVLSLLSVNPCDPQTIKELQFASGLEVVVEQGPSEDVRKAIETAYNKEQGALYTAYKELQQFQSKDNGSCSCHSSGNPISYFTEQLINYAVNQRASDIHFEPHPAGCRIRLRIDGVLKSLNELTLSKSEFSQITRYLKVLAKLDITARHKFQHGSFITKVDGEGLNIRISTLCQAGGEKVALRLLNSASELPLRFEELGMDSSSSSYLRSTLAVGTGVILVTGPTGSGKTTLLYSALNYLSGEEKNIVTIEDPVEIFLDNINQIQFSSESGDNIEEIFQTVLRQDPDVIMMGESRSAKMAGSVFRAGVTGHLVLSTLHAGNCFEALHHLWTMGVNSSLIASSLKMIISQRLIRKICPYCARPDVQVSPFVRKIFHLPENFVSYYGAGCELCAYTGNLGRIAVFEILPFSKSFQAKLNSIVIDKQLAEIKLQAFSSGYRPLCYDVRRGLLKGVINSVEALKALEIKASSCIEGL